MANTLLHAPSTSPAREWYVLPDFVLRQTGFEFAILEELRDRETHDAFVELSRMVSELQRLRREVFEVCIGSPDRAGNDRRRIIERRLAKRLALGDDVLIRLDDAQRVRVEEWNAAVRALVSARNRARTLHDEGFAKATRRLEALFDDNEALRLAVFLSNEHVLSFIDTYRSDAGGDEARSRHRRRIHDLLAMYLQRFCAKNETNAHFGPFAVGQLSPDGATSGWSVDRGLRPQSFVAFWAAAAIAGSAFAEVGWARGFRPRLVPAVRIVGEAARKVVYVYKGTEDWRIDGVITLPLTPLEARIAGLCDGRLSVSDLEATCSDAKDALQTLYEKGLITSGCEVPVGSADPFSHIRTRFVDSGELCAPWLALVDEIAATVEELPRCSADSRAGKMSVLRSAFTDITGQEASRGAGEMYADRSLVYQETVRDLEGLIVGGRLRDAILEEVPLFLESWFLPAFVTFAKERVLLADWHRRRFGAGSSVSHADFIEAFIRDRHLLRPAFGEIEQQAARVAAQLEACLLHEADMSSHRVAVDQFAVQRFIVEELEKLAIIDPAVTAIVNPDVMVAARDLDSINVGDFQLVVADCHAVRDLLTSASWCPAFELANPEFKTSGMDLMTRMLEPGEVLLEAIQSHHDKTDVRSELPCLDLEVLGFSPKPRDSVVSIGELYVRNTPRGLVLELPRQPRWQVRLMDPPIGHTTALIDPMAGFCFPRAWTRRVVRAAARRHVPRITVGRVIYGRETWRFQPSEIAGGPSSADGYELVASVRHARGLPRFVFGKFAEEEKPLFVDFESPVLVRQLVRLARKSHDTIELSEMVPAPDHLWLTRGNGRVCSEFRLSMVFGYPGRS